MCSDEGNERVLPVYDIVRGLIDFLYKHNIRVPPSQISLYADMLKTFTAMKGSIGVQDIVDLARSVFTLVNWTNDLEKELMESLLHKKKSKDQVGSLLESKLVGRIRFGRNISLQELLPPTASQRDIEEYIFLRKIGAIKRDRRGRLKAVRYNEFIDLVKKHKREDSSINVDDIIRFIPEIPSRHWSKLLTEEVLDKASLNQLLKLGSRITSSRDKSLGKRVLTRISRILSEGHHLKSRQKKIVYKLMKHTGYVDNTLLFETIPVSPNANNARNLSTSEILSRLSRLPLKERMKVLPKLQKSLGDNHELYDKIDIVSLTALNTSSNKRLQNKVFLGKALAQIIKYYISGNESFLDYANHYLEKIDVNSLDPRYKPVYESLVSNDFYGALNKLGFYDRQSVLEYTIFYAKELSTKEGSREVLKRALEIGYRLLRNFVFRKGGRYEGYRIISTRGGRVAVRNTMYQILRLNYKILFMKKIRGRDVIALLDTSGSMLPYSLWALIALATIIHRLKYIILFSDKQVVVRISRRKKSSLMNILENILATSFQGYTDIAGALRKSLLLCRRKSVIVLISDLKQTLPGSPLDVVEDIISKGHRVIVITHPDHDADLAHKLITSGIDVIVAESPYNIPFILKKKLNLKGSVVKESKRLEDAWLRKHSSVG